MLTDDVWELYHLDEDFTQANDLADKRPEKLKEFQAVFMQEADLETTSCRSTTGAPSASTPQSSGVPTCWTGARA